MAEERTLGIARARDTVETVDDQPSKEELQRRMEEARDSITNTVTEIKETVAQQYENVKDALDWREHFKKQPLAWTIGAAGVGLFVGYGVAAAIKGEDSGEHYGGSSTSYSQDFHAYEGQPIIGTPAESSNKANGKHEGPSVLARFKETSAYERLSKEVGELGDHLIDELSTTARQ